MTTQEIMQFHSSAIKEIETHCNLLSHSAIDDYDSESIQSPWFGDVCLWLSETPPETKPTFDDHAVIKWNDKTVLEKSTYRIGSSNDDIFKGYKHLRSTVNQLHILLPQTDHVKAILPVLIYSFLTNYNGDAEGENDFVLKLASAPTSSKVLKDFLEKLTPKQWHSGFKKDKFRRSISNTSALRQLYLFRLFSYLAFYCDICDKAFSSSMLQFFNGSFTVCLSPLQFLMLFGSYSLDELYVDSSELDTMFDAAIHSSPTPEDVEQIKGHMNVELFVLSGYGGYEDYDVPWPSNIEKIAISTYIEARTEKREEVDWSQFLPLSQQGIF